MAPSEAVRVYAEMLDAVEGQRQRLNLTSSGTDRWSSAAARFQADPRRELGPNLRAIAEYVEEEHVVLDVGGGAGRYGLPLALRCRQVINIDPAEGMGAAFEASAESAGITNARWLASDWINAEGVIGDVSLVAHVTYFVRDIAGFIEKLASASDKRVIIAMSATPPPNQGADVFRIVHDEPQALVPGYRELLPVLWDMKILPDVRVLASEATTLAGVFPSREEAIQAAVSAPAIQPNQARAAVEALRTRFDEFFVPVSEGFRRRPTGDTSLLLITWPTSSS